MARTRGLRPTDYGVVLTGVQTDEHVQRGRLPTINGFVEKPPKIGALYDAIVQALGL